MTLPLTPEIIESAYEFLRATPPFKRWKLPTADDVVFHVNAHPVHMGSYSTDGEEHAIYISVRMVGHTSTLIRVMAHEMAHMKQAIRGDKNMNHNAKFFRLTKSICRYHGFDPKEL